MSNTEQILKKIKMAQHRLSNSDFDHKKNGFVIEDVGESNGSMYSIVMCYATRVDLFADLHDGDAFDYSNMVLSIRLDWISHETAAKMIEMAMEDSKG